MSVAFDLGPVMALALGSGGRTSAAISLSPTLCMTATMSNRPGTQHGMGIEIPVLCTAFPAGFVNASVFSMTFGVKETRV